MLDVTTLARPYARAFFEVALDENDLSSWSETLALLSEITQCQAVNTLLKNPNVTKDQLADLVIALTKGRLSEEGKNAVRLLANNARLHVIPVIAELFEKLRLEQEKTVDVTITSAVTLDDEYTQKLKTLLASKLDRKTNVQCELDESLLGGLLIRTGDTVIDGSIKGELNRLKEVLMG